MEFNHRSQDLDKLFMVKKISSYQLNNFAHRAHIKTLAILIKTQHEKLRMFGMENTLPT